MARNKGWWTLELEGNTSDDLSDADKEHIARLIKDGFTSGEIVKDSLTIRDVAKELNLFGMNEDWREKSLKEFLEFNGYKIADHEDDWGEYEYSDIKAYLDVEIEAI